jgi:hypothetical protein
VFLTVQKHQKDKKKHSPAFKRAPSPCSSLAGHATPVACDWPTHATLLTHVTPVQELEAVPANFRDMTSKAAAVLRISSTELESMLFRTCCALSDLSLAYFPDARGAAVPVVPGIRR